MACFRVARVCQRQLGFLVGNIEADTYYYKLYVNSCSPEGVTKLSRPIFSASITVIHTLYSNFFYQKQINNLLIIKIYGKQKFVRFCYLVLFISTLLFGNGYLFYIFFVIKNNAALCRSKVKWCHFNRDILSILNNYFCDCATRTDRSSC